MGRGSEIIVKTLLAGVLLALAGDVLAEVVTDGAGNRFHITADGQHAELTFLATDSTNVSAYVGDLMVPQQIIKSSKWLPVTGVTPLACAYCSELESVSLPEGIETIGLGAFSDCPKLQEVSLPASLTEMHDLVFYRDSALQRIQIPQTVSRVGSGAFAYCVELDSIGLKQGLSSIASQAFYYCPSLTSVFIPASVNAIGEYAFAYCTGLEQIMMSGSPLAITPDVFEGVDVSGCRLIVPTDEVEAYMEAEVWCDFQIEGGSEALPETVWDESEYFFFEIHGNELWITANGDAPALVYDMMGRRIAVAVSRSGECHIALESGGNYIIRCGRMAKVIAIP